MKFWNPRTRAMIVCVLLGAALTAISLRLIEIQLAKTSTLSQRLDRRPSNPARQILPARRGSITDRHGELLAADVRVSTIVADQSKINKPDDIAATLAPALGLLPQDLAARLRPWDPSKPDRYVPLRRKFPQEQAEALIADLQRQKLTGITLEYDSARVYPNGLVFAHLLGGLDHEHRGAAGLERSAERILAGIDGFQLSAPPAPAAATAFLPSDLRQEPLDGQNLRLTTDITMQMDVEREMDALAARFHPDRATIIVMEPHSGDILALACRPTFDCNEWNKAKPSQTRNFAVQDMIEPGSIFKIVVAAAALEEKLVNLRTPIFCENGAFLYHGYTLHDHKAYGTLSVEDIIAQSSNIGCAKLGIQLGPNRLYSYITRFGFGSPTGVALPSELKGTIHPVRNWNSISITRVPIGHEVAVTPLQMTTAMCVIANGGKLVLPRILAAISDPQGQISAQYPPVEKSRVISSATARTLTQALRSVVTKGTATKAAVPGYLVAGKTGTAEKVNAKGTAYLEHAYVSSFLGFMPADDPAFVCLVMLDNPRCKDTSYYGGSVAAPSFSNLAQKFARHLGLKPTEPIKDPATEGDPGE